MLTNYLRIAFRSLRRSKFFSLINILGLAIGICSFLLIIFFVQDELSFDKHLPHAERMYRMDMTGRFGGNEFNIAVISAAQGPQMKEDFPEVEDYVRFRTRGYFLVKYGEDVYKEESVSYVDANVFDFFGINMISGDPATALKEPKTLVITEALSKKLFGDEEALGKVVKISNDQDYKITGVMAPLPQNTHFHFDILASMETLDEAKNAIWLSQNFQTYFRLAEGASVENLEAKFPEMVEKYIGPELERFMGASMEDFAEAGNNIGYYMTPVTDIHLYSQVDAQLGPPGDIKYVYIFSAVAAFILIIACVNFMNLATARSANRAKEVGVRKVMGAYRHNLISQFLLESLIITGISFVVAIGLLAVALPYFNELTGKVFSLSILATPTLAVSLVAILIVVGLLAGSYPAFFLSAFQPASVLKGKLNIGMKSGSLRSVLVVLQFSISIFLVVGTLIVFDQLDYIQTKKLGYDREQLIVLQNTYVLDKSIESFKNEVVANSYFKSGSISGFLPIRSNSNNSAMFPGRNPKSNSTTSLAMFYVDYDYIPTLGMELLEGRNFSKDFGADSTGVIINEATAKQFGIADDPIGQELGTFDGDDSDPEDLRIKVFKVIGVVKDFHFESLKTDIRPAVIFLGESTSRITFKLNTIEYAEAISFLHSKWDEFAPGQPFEYAFYDEEFNAEYKAEEKIGEIFGIFAGLAIFIACLGLFGLAAFTAEQRTKEVGIRKVLGASIGSIILLLSKEFMKLVLIAFVITVPLAWFAMDAWLQDFAYRTTIGAGVFALAGGLSFVIAWLTMSVHSFKAAAMNPSSSLRTE
ncbi:ABC transporter permease [uncultured Imperialibacter sp.]|uniref:ABC transporter permease n=1 Tax=uncultured Imperialibacter sp. TaxID=1672639 RepID=UPI0030D9427F|tara:strand:- start:5446 stop:7884 length:2439 start_codon:yes stop_codon:yes gene_type:complete